jgi:hypothetical protein
MLAQELHPLFDPPLAVDDPTPHSARVGQVACRHALNVPILLAFGARAGQSVAVGWNRVRRVAPIVAALLVWTFLTGSCAGLIAMSGADSTSGGWPVGATIALIILALVWVGLPALVFWRRRGHRPR